MKTEKWKTTFWNQCYFHRLRRVCETISVRKSIKTMKVDKSIFFYHNVDVHQRSWGKSILIQINNLHCSVKQRDSERAFPVFAPFYEINKFSMIAYKFFKSHLTYQYNIEWW